MVNSKDFSDRLKKIMKYYDLSASSLADKIQVQRSSISHILSERNKPSLEFVLKILNHFPEVSFYWLLKGEGEFPLTKKVGTDEKEATPTLFSSETPVKTSIPEEKQPIVAPPVTSKQKSDIERIVIFYGDGTFKEYTP